MTTSRKDLAPVNYLAALMEVVAQLRARGVTDLHLSRYELDRLNDAAETGLALHHVTDWIIASRAEPRFGPLEEQTDIFCAPEGLRIVA